MLITVRPASTANANCFFSTADLPDVVWVQNRMDVTVCDYAATEASGRKSC
jgi:hypothetical protein